MPEWLSEGLTRSAAVVFVLVGAGFAVSGIQSIVLAGAFWLASLLWLFLNLWSKTRDRVPRLVLSKSVARATQNASNRTRMLHTSLRKVHVAAGEPDYRDAARQLARLLYVNEGLYAQASGSGEISEEGQWAEPAPKGWWGDPLYDLLGLPREDEYR